MIYEGCWRLTCYVQCNWPERRHTSVAIPSRSDAAVQHHPQHRLPPTDVCIRRVTLTAVLSPLPLTPSLSPARPSRTITVPATHTSQCLAGLSFHVMLVERFFPCWVRVNWALWLARPPSDLMSAAGARLLGFAFLTSDLSFLFPLISLLRFLHWSCSNDSELALDCRALTTWYKFSISWILIRFKQITQLIQHFNLKYRNFRAFNWTISFD